MKPKYTIGDVIKIDDALMSVVVMKVILPTPPETSVRYHIKTHHGIYDIEEKLLFSWGRG